MAQKTMIQAITDALALELEKDQTRAPMRRRPLVTHR